MIHPIEKLTLWIQDELEKGAPNPAHAVLSTVGLDNKPHARVIAIKTISNEEIIFFTQRDTKKVEELLQHKNATLTFWFELSQRQVIIESLAIPLSDKENETHWHQYPKNAQMRFYSYAPTSAKPIHAKQDLQSKLVEIQKEYENKPLPVSEFYCGFRLVPMNVIFYTFRTDELSDVIEYKKNNELWCTQNLSP